MAHKLKHITIAIALLSMGAANATVTTLTAGSGDFPINDPAGSGRTGFLAYLSGSGTLTFSNNGANYAGYDANTVGGAVGALNTGLVFLTGGGGVNVQEQWKSYAQSGPGFESVFFPTKTAADADPLNAPYYSNGEINTTATGSFRLGSAAAAPVGSIVIKTANSVGDTTAPVGSIQTAISSGYAIQSATANAALTGGTLKVDNIVFDLYNGNVNAIVSGTKSGTGSGKSAVPPVVFTPQTMTLWTFAGIAAGGTDISGPTAINVLDWLATDNVDRLTNPAICGNKCFTLVDGSAQNKVFRATTSISNLTMTPAGMNFFNSALGTTATGQAALNGVNGYAGKWGTVQSNLDFVVYVPEPSTYALMGMGLLGICLASRRRRQGSH